MSIDSAPQDFATLLVTRGFSSYISPARPISGLAIRTTALAQHLAPNDRELCGRVTRAFPNLNRGLTDLHEIEALQPAILLLCGAKMPALCLVAFCRMVAKGLGDCEPYAVNALNAWGTSLMHSDVADFNDALRGGNNDADPRSWGIENGDTEPAKLCRNH